MADKPNVTSPARIKGIDSLRGIAALVIAVFWHYRHFTDVMPLAAYFSWFYIHGQVLIDMFFVISGFVFVHVYEQKILESKISAKLFAWKRVARLYPLHLLTLLVAAALHWLYYSHVGQYFVFADNSLKTFLMNLGLVQFGWIPSQTEFSFNGPAWAVSIEIISYLAFFVSLSFFRNLRPLIKYIALVIFGAVIVNSPSLQAFINWRVGEVLFGFFAGAILYHIHLYISQAPSRRRSIILFAALVAAVKAFSIFQHTFAYFLFAAVIFPVIIIWILHAPLLNKIASHPALELLGALSYSIYLWHFPIQQVITLLPITTGISIDFTTTWFFFAYIAILISVSFVSYKLIEQPARRYLLAKLH